VASAARLGSRIDAGLLAGCVVLSLIAVVLPTENKEPIASALRRTIVAPLVLLQSGAERWRSAWISAEVRRISTDSIAMRAVKAQALQLENDQLRKVIGLGTRLEWGFVPAEALHSTEPSEDVVRTMTLTAGGTAGIKRYSPVVAPEGLVGTIQTADPTMSIAILYTHPDFRASAMSADGQAFGIVYPHASRGAGGDAYMLELRGVPTRVNLKPGTVLYTSGLGGTFPRGITIGSVVQELKTTEVWTRTYLLRPAVTPSRVTTVLVLTAQRVTQGIGNVWGAAVNADSATKRIVAAGAKRGAGLREEGDDRLGEARTGRRGRAGHCRRQRRTQKSPGDTGDTGDTGSTADAGRSVSPGDASGTRCRATGTTRA
jgi:rod shape-determining protein MreC